MNLEKLVAVSGLPGLHKVVGNRSNGLIIEDLDSGKRRFASTRQYQFTPLGSIAIYTDDGESTELKNVFISMQEKLLEGQQPADPNTTPDALFAYFSVVLPNYDRDRVHAGDVKKVIRWFNFLNAKGLLVEEAQADEEE
jgi:hypothetical protein